jgi:4-hydroxy-2-oxoheptanedioate aldolase
MTVLASLTARLKAGDGLALAWSALPEPAVVEMLLRAGYDAGMLDMQHGGWTYERALAGIAAAGAAGRPCIVRIPVGDFATASRLLDAGAAGIVAPMIDSPADARAFARFCKYPPTGQRSWGPMRAMDASGLSATDYLGAANGLQIALAMIETRAALDALDAILDVEGIDGVLVGPADLSIALSGGRTLDPLAKEVDAAMDKVAAACRARGKWAAAYTTSGARARATLARGFHMVSISNDQYLLREIATAELVAAKAK